MQVFFGHCSRHRKKYPPGAGIFRSLQQTTGEVSIGHRYSGFVANPLVIPTGFRYFLVTAANPKRTIHRTQVFRSLQQTKGGIPTGCGEFSVTAVDLGRSIHGTSVVGHCSKPPDTSIPVTAANHGATNNRVQAFIIPQNCFFQVLCVS
jgi:hypothetical protein